MIDSTQDPATPATELMVNRKPALPPDVLAKIDERRIRNMAVQQIRGSIWGKDLGDATARAIADYCHENGIDPVRHVEVLGGRLYLTAEFYDELGAPLIQQGLITIEPTDFITADPRLDKLAFTGDAWAKGEAQRRLRERIRLGAPDEATAVAVTRLRIVASDTVVEGCSWCGGGTRKKMGRGGQVYDGDPIGDLEPTKTAETRSRRRAWRKISRVFQGFADQVEKIEHGIGAVRIVDEVPAPSPAYRLAGDTARPRDENGKPIPEVTVVHTSPHEADEPTEDAEIVRPEPSVAELQVAADAAAARERIDREIPPEEDDDPFGPPPATDPVAASNQSEAANFICPFGHDGIKGKRLGDVDSAVLEKSLKWARENQPSRYRDFIDAAGVVLADRAEAIGQAELGV